MKANGKRILFSGILLITVFAIWTLAVLTVDVKPSGVNGTNIGFAALNGWFHNSTGIHMDLYVITDWLGLVPVAVCMIFAAMGFVQLVKRRSLFKVDMDIILLGVYYIIVILAYLVFEMYPVNYRPVLIDGRLEASYPSSTTLLVLSVMPTLAFQAKRRLKNIVVRRAVSMAAYAFSAFMVTGRLVSGVHWFTDIIGGILLAAAWISLYIGVQTRVCL
jgi:undecaprenyl-diphosphatase